MHFHVESDREAHIKDVLLLVVTVLLELNEKRGLLTDDLMKLHVVHHLLHIAVQIKLVKLCI